MKAIEADCQTRVRKGGADHSRPTDELVWAEFMHQTARPVDGFAPDPHLHSHCFVFNMTWDKEEQRIKAGDFGEIKRDMPYYQALFHKMFSNKLIELGYGITRTAKSFEIDGVPKEVIDLFSKRTNEIGQFAKENGITDARKLSELGAITRSKKQKGLSMSELKTIWRKEIGDITAVEKDKPIRYASKEKTLNITPQNCVSYALQHCFERASVIAERRLLESALRHGIGDGDVSSDAIASVFQSDLRIIKVKEKDRSLCTTKEVLAEEKKMVALALAGRGQIAPLYRDVPEMDLKDQQRQAVAHILTTSNRVSIIRGVAGAGKTTLMKEAKRLIEATGKELVVVAPSSNASRGVLKDEGFENADTTARLILDDKMKEKLQGGVLMVDEAGLLGTKDMTALLNHVTEKDAQLILVGDTRQHASVVRGDALRILNTVAKIRTAEVSKIYRQINPLYKSAVEDLSKGEIKSAFEKLETMEAIKEVSPMNPNEAIAKDYVELIKKNKTALIISPTHKQAEKLTMEIREALKSVGVIGKKGISAKKLVNLNLTEAQKSDYRNMKPGQVVQFSQNAPNIQRGSDWKIISVEKAKVQIANQEGTKLELPKNLPNRYDIFEESEMPIAKGDKIMATRGGFDLNKKRMENGQHFEVTAISKGKIRLQNKLSKAVYEVDKNFGHLAHAHCLTSYASQGKTVDHVLISQPASTFGATDAKQFYVSVSRARLSAKIYTDDKEALLDSASRFGDRQSAIELVGNEKPHLDYVIGAQRLNYSKTHDFERSDKLEPFKDTKEREYEP